METADILRLLKNAGFQGLRADAQNIYMEDPSCVLRAFETFIDYAWLGVVAVTALLIFGWGIALIRGSKYDSMLMNIRNLILILGSVAITKPIVNAIYGEDLFARGCKIITISIEETQKLLDARNEKLKSRNQYDLYESINIYDSGVKYSEEELAGDESVNPDDVIAEMKQSMNTNNNGANNSGESSAVLPGAPIGAAGFNGSGIMPTNATE